MMSLSCCPIALLTWTQLWDGDRLGVAGRLERNCILSSVECNWSIGFDGRLVRASTVSSGADNVLRI